VRLVHLWALSCPDVERTASLEHREVAKERISFLGPAGTFTEEALLTQPDYSNAELVPLPTLQEVLEEVNEGRASIAFVPLENAIEGTVNATLDSLVFETDLLIQREVVLDVHLNLLAPPGTSMSTVRRVLSFPVATAQCRRFVHEQLTDAEIVATNSTAEAARILGETKAADTAAIAPRLAARLYGLEVIAPAIEDHPDNKTRFVAVAPKGIPAPTGHDKTSIVCFQRDDRPGNLHGILGQFAARSINLTKLESRPTKRSLGEYCFIIDMEGHVADELVADCLRDLHAELAGGVKFLGSYPAASDHGAARRAEASASWKAADAWIASLREQLRR